MEGGRRKDGTPVPIPQFPDTMHPVFWENSFSFSSFVSVCLGAFLGHRRKDVKLLRLKKELDLLHRHLLAFNLECLYTKPLAVY